MKKSKGFARVEFRANIKNIRELTEEGYTKRSIYDQLKEKGKITMTYIHFCRFDPFTGQISKSGNSSAITGTPAVRTVSAPPALPDNSGGGSYSRKQEDFSIDKKVTEEQLDELT